ncbi:outer membrane protein assembly factor BamA [Aliidiomarina halalkaliphila]|uniref:Outer membrane protein assembly factor BamA n=1 Tax=Aliidiomarina halalkaliphila TaxID=2593535 RepID=A0A552X3H1_9GAMM|nr:outer membrane protein assembly factor BamA [Aliidiomarina halalkaliphila]TRW49577.1 outer membrane protein assembly factor BamA [Aliidiomarina halalkaliphila]
MTLKKLFIGVVLAGTGMSFNAHASDSFVVDDIQIRGLQRVGLGAALTYVPLRVGEEADPQRIRQIIHELYSSSHFDDVRVYRDGDALVIRVTERPTITNIVFDGNRDLKDEQLLDSLANNGIAEGESLDRTVISMLEKNLEDFYHSVGKYNARVEVQVVNLPRNRVELRFNFREGPAAVVEQINFIGNETFDRRQLTRLMELRDELPWWNILGKRNYQQQQLMGDLEEIESFYRDQGFLRFNIESVQVAITPELEGIYIAVNVAEGDRFDIKDARAIGELRDHEEFLNAFVKALEGRRYNQAEVTDIEETIKRYFGRYGYARTEVRAVPEIDDENKLVSLTFSIDPGQRIYVRRINFEGNDATKDEVLRREMRQIEGSWLNEQTVEFGKVRLERLGYFETVEVETIPVPGEPDQVDVVYRVKEQPSGTISAGIGYGDFAGLSLNASVSQDNFLGSGNRVSFSVDTNRYSRNVQLNYVDNYFTDDGVSLGGTVFYTDFDARQANLSRFNQRSWGVGTDLGFPINEYNRLNFGVGYKSTGITQREIFDQIRSFYTRYADPSDPFASLNFVTYDLTAAWTRNTLNRGVFPTAGTMNQLSGKVTTPNSDLQYFKIDYRFRYYRPFDRDHDFVLLTRLGAGYGNGYGQDERGIDYRLPFWENFYGGGTGSLRGFEANRVGPRGIIRRPQYTLGPPDADGNREQIALGPEHDRIEISRFASIGGNAQLNGSFELIFPTPFVGEEAARTVRTSAFVDVGVVWDTEFNYDEYRDLQLVGETRFWDYGSPRNYQASYGVSVQWLSPMGVLSFSLGFPIRSLDRTLEDRFTFNIGTSF